MQEHSTLALIVGIDRVGEADARVTLYTELFGKIIARSKSLYKPTSKLAAHVQPLTVARVRLVEKRGVQLVDALVVHRLIYPGVTRAVMLELLGVAKLISELTQPYQPDAELWELIRTGKLMSRALLRTLGFDPDHARCQRCRNANPAHFMIQDATYLCANCFAAARTGAMVEIPLAASVL